MSDRPDTRWRRQLAVLFFFGLLGLSFFPPDTAKPIWKDPFLIVLALAMLWLLLIPGRKR